MEITLVTLKTQNEKTLLPYFQTTNDYLIFFVPND
jgi:hypothetical protein